MDWVFRLLVFIGTELSRNDVTYRPAHWYCKANILLAHAALAVGISALVLVSFSTSIAYPLLVCGIILYSAKEQADIIDGGLPVVTDSLVDTLAVIGGICLAVALTSASAIGVYLSALGLFVGWISFPIKAFIDLHRSGS